MRIDVTIPSSGESVSEGDIARWFKEDGDMVEQDEPLLELETDKASLEIPAEEAGRLSILVEEGETVEVGQVVGHIDTDAKGESKSSKKKAAEKEKEKDSEDEEDSEEEKDGEDEEDSKESTSPNRFEVDATDEEDKGKHASVFNLHMPSPAARKLITENQLSAKDIKGTGRNGRITKADVLKYLKNVEREEASLKKVSKSSSQKAEEDPPEEKKAESEEKKEAEKKDSPKAAKASAPPAMKGDRTTRREKMSRIRKTIAERLVKTTQELAMLTTFNEVDMSGIMDIRSKYKESFKDKHEIGLGFMSFFTKAVCLALQEFPLVNAMIDESEIVYHDYCDIGIAVSTPKGLLVPVVRNAEMMNFQQIESSIMDLAIRGRDGKLSLDEMQSGTFTITNGGIFGSMLSTPLINYPQSAILGMHNIVQRPVAINGEVVIRPIMYVALSYDHRIVDGKEAVRFLVRVKEALEDPVRLMLQV